MELKYEEQMNDKNKILLYEYNSKRNKKILQKILKMKTSFKMILYEDPFIFSSSYNTILTIFNLVDHAILSICPHDL